MLQAFPCLPPRLPVMRFHNLDAEEGRVRGAAGRVLELRHVRLREEGRGGARRGRGAAHEQ